MRDQSIIQEFERLKQYIQMLENSVRLAFTGQEIRGAAIQSLLLKKQVIKDVDASVLVSKLLDFLSTKVIMTEEEKNSLGDRLRFAIISTEDSFLTQDELNAEIGATITNMQKQAEEVAKKQATEIIKPTVDQVQQVTNTPPPPPSPEPLQNERIPEGGAAFPPQA